MSPVAETDTEVANASVALWEQEIDEHRRTVAATAATTAAAFAHAVEWLASCVGNQGKILTFGNGGSAMDAQHITAELVVRYKQDRPAVPAMALTADSAILTACANDLGHENSFARQIEALGRPGDVAISTSGASPNVITALRKARSMGLKTVGLTGGHGGPMVKLCDVAIVVSAQVTARIQEIHILIGHMLCKALEERLRLV